MDSEEFSYNIKNALQIVEQQKKIVETTRDGLRDAISDLKDLLNGCDDALDSLNCACAALSRIV